MRQKCAGVAVLLSLALLLVVFDLSAREEDKKAKAKTWEVTVKDAKFLVGGKQQDLKIKVGDSVVWVNKDEEDHSATSEKESKFKFDVEIPEAKKSKPLKFTKAGKFKYYCKYHDNQKGTIVVEK